MKAFHHSLSHVFIAEGSSHAYSSVSLFKTPAPRNLPRFLSFFFTPTETSEIPFLQLYASETLSIPVRHATVFPSTSLYRVKNQPLVFVLDLFLLSNPLFLHPLLIFNHANADPPPVSPSPNRSSELQFTAEVLHYRLSYRDPITSFEPVALSDSLPDVTQLISAQPLQNPALSAHSTRNTVISSQLRNMLLPNRVINTPAPTRALPFRSDALTIYCESVDGTLLLSPSVTVSSVESPALNIAVRAMSKMYRSSSVFVIDLSRLSERVRAAGLLLASKSTAALKWTPPLGYHVILAASFPRLLMPSEMDMRLFYHRFGDVADWRQWRVRLSSVATDEHPARSVVLPAFRPLRPGVIWFNLTDALFPYDVDVDVMPFRVLPRTPVENSGTPAYGPSVVDPAVELPDRCDVVRRWKSGHVHGDVHLVQGDGDIHFAPPCRRDLESRRWFRLRYRRFLPNDYAGWDLWTWDGTDPSGHGTSVPCDKAVSNLAFSEFVIDRGAYGTGTEISFKPRQGGIKWTDKDDPVRVWHEDILKSPLLKCEHDLPTFLITQGTHFVLHSLEEVRGSHKVFVENESSITIRTPVPIEWMCPPRADRPIPIKDTVVKFCDLETANRVGKGDAMPLDISGKAIQFHKVVHISPVEKRLLFSKRDANLDEDYPVERVIVLVPGFRTVVLSWERHDDWDKYLYEGMLGWDYRKEVCLFRCFAPTADGVFVVLYDCATGKAGRTVLPMRQIPEGCWKVIVKNDLRGKYYTLLVEGENKRLFPGVEIIDPYSRCNTAHNGRGLIFGAENTVVAPRPDIKPFEAIVYELHIRDVTIDKESGISRRGKFCGLAERGTRYLGESDKVEPDAPLTKWEQEKLLGVDASVQHLDQFSTGLDHIAQMGVTTVQILPIQDFDNDESDNFSYRWGYMPVHFNSPDGWYASSTVSEARITEFKQLVDAIHKAGMKVIMDVVYNHTAEDVNEFNLDARFSFNGLVPRYYYRTCGNTPIAHSGDSTCGKRAPYEPRCGECYSNGSGCGNEFRSEAPMGRKFIIDSLKYWVNEYQVDGFRFDLLGLIDVDTITQAASALHAIDKNIMLYGEPWCGGLTPIRMTEKGMQRSKGFGVFNNTFRDAIRGSPFDSEETFVMDGGRLSEVKGGIIGSIDSFCDAPIETINYVECHDNYTLWDHFRFYVRTRTGDIQFTEEDLRRMHKLAAVIIFTSQGVPFMQAGQEMCRTKFDVENSYESPDEINMIRWKSKVSEWTTVCYYRGLILLRRSHPEIFCMQTAAEIHESLIFYEDLGLPVPDRCIAYRIEGDSEKLLERRKRQQGRKSSTAEMREEAKKWTEVVVLLNPTPSQVLFRLPEGQSDCIWFQVVDASHAGVRDIRGPAIGSLEVQGRSAAVLRRASLKDTTNAQLLLRLDTISDSYCSFHGDNGLSAYAAGLNQEPTADEIVEMKNLRLEREKFEGLCESARKEASTADVGISDEQL